MAELPNKQRDVDRLISTGASGIYKSSKVPRMYLEVRGVGAASYKVRFEKVGGRERRQEGKHKLGDAKIITIGQAEEAARAFLATLQTTGQDPRDDASGRTFSDVFSEWLDRHAKPNKKSWPRDAALFTSLIKPRLGGRVAREITKRDIIDTLNDIAANVSGIQANRCQAVISVTLNWAEDEAIIDISPARGIKRRVREVARDRVLSDSELRAFWYALDKMAPPQVARVLRLLLMTGLRLSEVVGAERSEIEGDVWTIPASRTKSKTPHAIPLAAGAAAVLREAMAQYPDSRFVFPAVSRGTTLMDKPMSRHTPDHKFAEIAVALRWVGADGKPNAGVHDIRRTTATALARLGTPTDLIDRIQGRSLGTAGDSGVSWVYNRHTYLDERRGALARWEDDLLKRIVKEAQKP